MNSIQDILPGSLPTQNIKKDAVLDKLCAGEVWQKRQCVLTNEVFVCAKLEPTTMGRPAIIDEIPLCEIKSCEKHKIEVKKSGPLTKTNTLRAAAGGGSKSANLFGIPTMDRGSSRKDLSGMDGEGYFKVVQWVDGSRSECTHIFRVDRDDEAEEWVSVINFAVKAAIEHMEFERVLQGVRERCRIVYCARPTQLALALLIVINFVVDAWETQVTPPEFMDNEDRGNMFYWCDIFFSTVFALEVAFNIFAHWFYPFFSDGWNLFDLAVVSVNTLSLILAAIPGLGVLRLLRVFRVLRLFGRLKAMRRMVTALSLSMWPVTNALIVLVITMSVYAILGVKIFGYHGTWHFDSFLNAFFTMFQVITYDNWASEVVAPLMDDHSLTPGIMVFFLSFIIIVAWCMLPAVLALLVENFIDASMKEEERAAQDLVQDSHTNQVSRVLDPLLETLAYFETPGDLKRRTHDLFSALDVEAKGLIGYTELCNGLRRLQVLPGFQLSRDDYEAITEGGTRSNASGEMNIEAFHMVMKKQLRLFVQRQASSSMAVGKNNTMNAVLSLLKIMMLSTDCLEDAAELDAKEEERYMGEVTSGPPGGTCGDAFNSGRGSGSPFTALSSAGWGTTVHPSGGGRAGNVGRALDRLLKGQMELSAHVRGLEARLFQPPPPYKNSGYEPPPPPPPPGRSSST